MGGVGVQHAYALMQGWRPSKAYLAAALLLAVGAASLAFFLWFFWRPASAPQPAPPAASAPAARAPAPVAGVP
ncbi:hypothetical protein GTP41_26550, partial [Pseudoduganella sp. DS3]|nr:hypothetical protein [Pseudoduganella guangdongensis]